MALDILLTGEVGDGAGDLDNAFVGSGREVEVAHGTLEQFVAGSVELGVAVEEGGVHLCVAVDALHALVAFLLYLPCLDDALTDIGRRLSFGCVGQLLEWYALHFDMQVYPIEDFRARKSFEV